MKQVSFQCYLVISLYPKPQADSLPFFNLHPRAKVRPLVIFYLIIVDFSVSDSSIVIATILLLLSTFIITIITITIIIQPL